ncbi:MAG: OprD family outer membrane porin [Campylobacterales bacterium]|nr:OprD family outer membrane porin [Campylobacterales bacterium]HEO98795.1 outer membrane porin, OprD family [Campylobacterota bacterium]
MLIASLSFVNTHAEEMSWGRFDTHIELFHYDINGQEDQDSRATVLGGYLHYISRPVYHFGVGVKQYLSDLIFYSKNPALTSLTDSAGEDINPLSELYAYYETERFALKLGKQQLSTPLLNDDTTRLIPFSYRGVTSRISWNTDTFLALGYITGFRANNSEDYTPYTSSGLAEDGVAYLGFHTQFGAVKHQWYYYHAPKLYNTLHMEVSASTPYNSSKTLLYGVQAIYTFDNAEESHTITGDNGGGDVRLIAAKVGIASQKFSYIGSLSYNLGEDGINRGYGGLSSLYTSSMITTGKKRGHPFAKSMKVHYKYYSSGKEKEYSSALHFTNVTYGDDAANPINAFYIDHKFKFRPREYILLRFEKQWIAEEDDKSYFRIISAYTF